MKAIVCEKYGSPDVLELKEIEKPLPKDNEIMVKVYATSVTAGDITDRKVDLPLLFRLPMGIVFGFWKPKRKIPGSDLAGEIEMIGKNVNRFNIGDKVFACTYDIGRCDWCNGIHIRCQSCGATIGIHDSQYNEDIECDGGCDLRFRIETEYVGHGMSEEKVVAFFEK